MLIITPRLLIFINDFLPYNKMLVISNLLCIIFTDEILKISYFDEKHINFSKIPITKILILRVNRFFSFKRFKNIIKYFKLQKEKIQNKILNRNTIQSNNLELSYQRYKCNMFYPHEKSKRQKILEGKFIYLYSQHD